MRLLQRNKLFIYISILTMIATWVPFTIASYFLYSSNKNQLVEKNMENISLVRDENIQQLKDKYSSLSDQLIQFSETSAFPFVANNQSISLKNVPNGVKNVHFISSDKKILYSYDETDTNYLLKVLNDQFFSEPIIVTDFIIKEGQLQQFIFHKVVEQQRIIGVSVYEIDPQYMQTFINEISDKYEIDVYNRDFKIIATTNEEKMLTSEINDITKNMLDGLTEVQLLNGQWHAYSFLDLSTMSVFIDVMIDEETVLQPLRKIQYAFLFIGFLSIFIPLFISGKVYRKSQRVFKLAQTDNQSHIHEMVEKMMEEKHNTLFLKLVQNISQRLMNIEKRLNEIKSSDEEYELHGFYRKLHQTLLTYIPNNKQAIEKMDYFKDLNDHFLSQYIEKEESFHYIKMQVDEISGIMRQYDELHSNKGLEDINNLIKMAVSETKKRYSQEHIKVELQLEEVAAISIQKDSIQKVFVGVLENAYEALHKKLRFKAITSEEEFIKIKTYAENNMLYIEIEDSGEGIDDALRKYYFSPEYSKKDQQYGYSLYAMENVLSNIGGRVILRNVETGFKVMIVIPY